MIRDLRRSVGCFIVILATVVGSCVEQRLANDVAVVPPDRTTCDHEAMQIMETAAVYAAPRSGLVAVTTLDQGRFVYRCEQRGEWLGVMFPSVGEKVDCSQRQSGSLCDLGWVQRDVKLQILG